jgi:inorganic pyrophosphatase
MSFSRTAPEAAQARHVSELDLARYGKDEFTVAMIKNIMLRCFSAFDVSHTGSVDGEQLKQMIDYLGVAQRPGGDVLLKEKPTGCTFDEFWTWWHAFTTGAHTDGAAESFAMVSAQFSVPFHVQQLFYEESGEKFTPGYRVHFKFRDQETGQVISVSPWHDIPLYVRSIVRTVTAPETESYNFITEIPKWTRAKFEISRREAFNPIMQDIKNGLPRFYKHGDMMWNYGAFPQTWESTDVGFEVEPGVRIKGDNDPLDGIEIGTCQIATGQTTAVKVLGVIGMIDDGEMDWKVICIANDDPAARYLNDIDDVAKYNPGCLEAIREWLRVYKIAQGGEENKFAFNGEYKNRAFAQDLLRESHAMWQHLRKVRSITQMDK